MIVRRIAAPLAPLLVLASLPLAFSVGTATAGVADPIEVAAPTSPLARGDDGDGDGMTAKDKNKKDQVVPCPEDLWTIPLQVEGLACVLLLPDKEEDDGVNDEPDDDDDDDDDGSGLGGLL